MGNFMANPVLILCAKVHSYKRLLKISDTASVRKRIYTLWYIYTVVHKKGTLFILSIT